MLGLLRSAGLRNALQVQVAVVDQMCSTLRILSVIFIICDPLDCSAVAANDIENPTYNYVPTIFITASLCSLWAPAGSLMFSRHHYRTRLCYRP